MGTVTVVLVSSSVVMLMVALAPRLFKGVALPRDGGGLLVILATVRQQGLYPPVEAVPPKPSSLCSSKV